MPEHRLASFVDAIQQGRVNLFLTFRNTFHYRLPKQTFLRTVHQLREALASGRWAERNRELVDLDAADLGARLLIA